MSGPRALVGLTASAIIAPATLGLASSMLFLHDSPSFREQLGDWMVGSLFVGIPIALFHAFVIAMPFYSALEQRYRLRWWSAALGGALVATGPAAFIALIGLAASVVSDGEVLEPLIVALTILGGLGLAGVAGGLVFWLFARGDPS